MNVRTCATGGLLLIFGSAWALCAQQPFTLQQVLSAPYASELTAAPAGDRFAWVENAEGHHNLWLGAPHVAAHQLTIFDQDDGLDLYNLAWSPDASIVAFTRTTEDGPDDKPSNPAHLQRKIEPEIWLAPVAGPVPTARTVQGSHALFSPDGHTLYFVRDAARSGRFSFRRWPCSRRSLCLIAAVHRR